jgi:hypothetical protein
MKMTLLSIYDAKICGSKPRICPPSVGHLCPIFGYSVVQEILGGEDLEAKSADFGENAHTGGISLAANRHACMVVLP